MKSSRIYKVIVLAFLLWLAPGLASGLQANVTPSACEGLLPADSSAAPALSSPWILCKLIEAGRLDNLVQPSFEDHRKEVSKFYARNNYALVWVPGQHPTSQARVMIGILQQSGFDGLDPNDYDGPCWQQRLTQLDSAPEALSTEDMTRFDLALTIAIMRYITDLHTGRVNPALFHFGLEAKQFDAAEFMRDRIQEATDTESVIKELEPTFAGYRRAKGTLRSYLALAEEGEGDPIPAAVFPIKTGMTYSGIAALTTRLQRLGDLAKDANVSPPQNIYRGVVVTAVKRFQKRHGLKPDGWLTQETYDQITTPFVRRVVQLQLALERLRWLPDGIEPPLIAVNIPEFQLRAYEDHHAGLAMRAIVGGSADHQTPVFADRIEAVVFRPYWSVPESIQKSELISALERQPHYLPKHLMEVIDGRGRIVTGDVVDAKTMQRLKAGELTIRQQPGPANALGLVKFVFPNQYSIYMHGTPETGLFARARRDLSHGCIRVEDPAALAAWILRDHPHWTAARIKAAMAGKASIEVKLRRSIPILIVYSTAFVTESGDVHFFNDIYGFDAILQTALEERHPTSIGPKGPDSF